MAKIVKQMNIEEDGIYLVFGVTDEEQLKLLHFSANPFGGIEEDGQYIEEGFQLVQVNFAGYNRPYEKHGNKHIVTAPGYLLKYAGMEDERNGIGRRLVITQKDDLTGAKVISYLQFYTGTSTVRMYHEVINEGEEEQTLEYVSSFYYLGIEKEGTTSTDEKMKLTYACHGWQKEMNFRTVTFPQMGFGQTQPRTNQRTSTTFELTNTGNWSTKKYLPMGYLENTEADCGLFWQIEHNGSWHAEISDENGHFYLALSGPTEVQSHWFKILKPGERFTTVPAAVGVSTADFAQAMGQRGRMAAV